MRYCAPLGIPHSQFLKWSDLDQDKALAWQADQDSRCPQCGTIPNEWMGEDGIPLLEVPYEVASEECQGCVTLAEERKLVPSGAAGVNLYLVRPGSVPRKDRDELMDIELRREREELEDVD